MLVYQPFDGEGGSSGHEVIFQVKLMFIQRMTCARGEEGSV